MRKFENHVQLIKYEILKEVSKRAMDGTLEETLLSIPAKIDPGPEPRFRCCVYHERAITTERVRMAMGGDRSNPNLIEVLDAACDQCLINRFIVTETCRGCIAHRCQSACPKDAITISGYRATIDYSKCIECGKCKTACPYNAIADVMRPCKKACPTNALEISDKKKAVINMDLCIQCGACVYQCPFGAIQEKSQVVDVIKLLNQTKKDRENSNLYAMIAPAFATQFEYATRGQVVNSIKQLGFRDVVEVALGADFVILHETDELLEKYEKGEWMTSSCCPAFVKLIELKYPDLKGHISTTVSPMTATSKLIKAIDPEAITVFIGPCTAKKSEARRKELKGITDYVLTFEELATLIDAAEIEVEKLEEADLDNASFYGRKLASSGGLTEGIQNQLKGTPYEEAIQTVLCDGIKACDSVLKRAKVNRVEGHFIEGMACEGGCIKGPVTLHYGQRDKKSLEAYCETAMEKNPHDAVKVFETIQIKM